MKARTETTQPIPSLFQYIWVGGPINADDLTQICELATTSRDSQFKTILWTDDEKNIQKTLERINLGASIYQQKRFGPRLWRRGPDIANPNSAASLGIEVNAKQFNIEVKSIHELLALLKTDPIFSDEETNQFMFNVLREAIGHRNLASVSDLIRYCSLYYFGGYYLDTELRAHISPRPLTADTSSLGIIGNFFIGLAETENIKRSFRLPYEEKYEIYGNNDAFGVTSRHPILRVAIQKTLNFYKKLDRDSIISSEYIALWMEQNHIPLDPFDRAFIEKLSLDENKTLKATFMNSLLDISFSLRLLKNTKIDSKEDPNEIQNKQADLIKALEELIEKTSSKLGLDPKKYTVPTAKKGFIASIQSLIHGNKNNTVVSVLSKKLLKHINLEIKQHQKQYGFGYEKATEMDAKRYPYQKGIKETGSKRRKHTVKAAVNSFCDAVTEFLHYHDNKGNSPYTPEEMAKFPTETLTEANFKENALELGASLGESTIMLADCSIQMAYANSWLKVDRSTKPSFDDSELPSKTKHSFFKKKESKVASTKEETGPEVAINVI